jgi:acetyl-CoA carboxylase carboxyl transferase subunit beta
MPISDWFKARDQRRGYTTSRPGGSPAQVPDGVWVKCPTCSRITFDGELTEDDWVCRSCGHHFEFSAARRIEHLADPGSFEEMDAGLASTDPLGFSASRPYPESLERARERTGLEEALITGRATIDGRPIVCGVMDFRFIGASMGSVVGEKVARAFEVAAEEGRAVVMVTASGGARMQEGMLSLMQMAKTSAAVVRLADAGLPYISILTHPTMGGVTASFAVLADVILAEPGAMVGFTGARVIELTINERLPKGFQSSESLLEHGMIDAVVPRGELRQTVSLLLGYLADGGGDGS